MRLATSFLLLLCWRTVASGFGEGGELLPQVVGETVYHHKRAPLRSKMIERGSQKLLDYLESCGMDKEKLRSDLNFDYDPSSGVLVTGKREFKRTELLFTVPQACLISSRNIEDTPLKIVKDALSNHMSPSHWITVFLMQERLKGKDSKYVGVLDLMPPQPTSLTYFNEEELNALQDHELVLEAWKTENLYRKSYQHTFLDTLHLISKDKASTIYHLILLFVFLFV